MATFLIFSKHSPENCPMFNEKARKLWLDYFNKSQELYRKHGARRIGAWTVPSEHQYVEVLEIPSLEVWEKLGLDPLVSAFGAYETYEVKLAYKMEEVAEMLKQAK